MNVLVVKANNRPDELFQEKCMKHFMEECTRSKRNNF